MSNPKPENSPTTIKGDVEVKDGDFVGRDKHIYIGSLKIPKFILWVFTATILLIATAALVIVIFVPGMYHRFVAILPPIHTPKAFAPASQDETLVLIADILIESCIDDPACPDDPNNVTQKFINSMRESLVDHPNIRVERLQQYIYEEGGSELAMEIGQRPEYNAAYVMWGNYVLEPEAEVYIFFDIMERDLPGFGSSYDESYGPSVIQPSIFDFKAELGNRWGQIAAFAAALALYQDGDYVDAVTLFDTAAQGTEFPLSQKLMRILHFYRGSNYLRLGRALEAKIDLEILQNEKLSGRFDDLTIPILQNLGFLYSSLDNNREALNYYNQVLSIRIELGNKFGQAITLNNIGTIYSALGDKQAALDYYHQAIAISIEISDKSWQSTVLNNIGRVYDTLGEKHKALNLYNQALLLNIEVGDKSSQAVILNNIGLVYDTLGENYKALNHYNQALPLSIEVGDKLSQATTLNNIGTVYNTLGENQEALNYYNQALPLSIEVGNKSGQAATLNNIGRVYYALGKRQEALEYYHQALPLRIEADDKPGQAITLNSIGQIYNALDNKKEALDYYFQALPLSVEVGDNWGERTTRFNIGAVYYSLGEYYKAEEQLLNVVQIDEAVGHPDLESDRAFLEQIQSKIAEEERE